MMTTEKALRLLATADQARRLAREAEKPEPISQPQPYMKGKPVTYQLSHEEVREVVRKQVFKGVRKAAKKAAKRAKKAARQDARHAFQKSAASDRLAADMKAEVERLRQKAAILTLQQRFAKSTDPEERQKLADLGQKLTYLALKKAHRTGEI